MKKILLTAFLGGFLLLAKGQNLDFHEDFSGIDGNENTYAGLVTWDLTSVSTSSLTNDAVSLDAGGSSITANISGGISMFRCEMYSSKSNNKIQVTVFNASNTVLSQNTFSSLKNTTIEVLLPAFTPETGCKLTIENTTSGGGKNKEVIIDDVSWMGFPIFDLQYTTNPSGDSPQNGNIVSTSGTVTGKNSTGFYIQNTDGSMDGSGDGDWSGIFVEGASINVEIMDYVTVTGTVDESSGKTTILVSGLTNYDAQITSQLGGNIPTANLIVGPLQEKDESVFSTILSSRYTLGDYSGGNYTMTIGFDTNEANNTLIPIDNDIFPTFEPFTNKLYEINGPVNFDNYFRISPIDFSGQIAGGTITKTKATLHEPWARSAKNRIMIKCSSDSHIQVHDLSGKNIYNFQGNDQLIDLEVKPGMYLISKTEQGFHDATKLVVR